MIKQEEVRQFPRFLNHKSARAYLKSIYGKHIAMQHTKMTPRGKVYHYHYVYDIEGYLSSNKALGYQDLEVTADGHVLFHEPKSVVAETN